MLESGATEHQLQQAVAANHTALFHVNTLLAGGTIHDTGGVIWTYGGANSQSMIAFPVLEKGLATNVLDEIIDNYVSFPLKGVGCWSLDPPQPSDLGVILLARGFQPGWFPNWMSLHLEELKSDFPVPDGLKVIPDNTADITKIEHLPYRDEPLKSEAFQQEADVINQRFIAIINNKIVAHSGVLLTKGTLGVAGIYQVGVLPGFRNRGIGKAVVAAACQHAKNMGYHYALLNGTGHRMYEQLGFKKLGIGHTWWLMGDKVLDHPPSKAEILLAEAIGYGDIDALNDLGNELEADDLLLPITNGMTLLQLAVHCLQPASAEWLQSRGIPVNVIDCWDLGWKEKAASMLNENPDNVNLSTGDLGLTLLHIAAERGDIELAKLALSAKPDLTIEDKQYHSTALNWARHLGKDDIVKLIEAYVAENA